MLLRKFLQIRIKHNTTKNISRVDYAFLVAYTFLFFKGLPVGEN